MLNLNQWLLKTVLLATAISPQQLVAQDIPTVVFESGLGDGGRVWRATIAKMGDVVPIFTYDRPGYGSNAASNTSRDPCTIARELHSRLQSAGKSPPYLLVGHSIGGQYAYAFARLFPDDMAGLVLVDATPVGHWQMLQKQAPAAAALVKTIRAISFSRTTRREFDAQEQCLASLPITPMAFPVRVLAKTVADPMGGARLLKSEHDLAQSWLAMTGATQVELVSRSSHYIQRDRPEVLAEAIHDVAKTRMMK